MHPPSQVQHDSSNDVIISDQSFQPRSTSTTTKCPSSALTDATDPVVSPLSSQKRFKASHMINTQTSPVAKQFAHVAMSPIRLLKPQELRPVADLFLPLTSQKEEYLTYMVKYRHQRENKHMQDQGSATCSEKSDNAEKVIWFSGFASPIEES